ncbi:hypothetical protein CEXT_260041 [Caerostris extrusa]|uniref:Uncharacterized protein n=1 Tax=Caerostris extrusa TaxID=172846 RepID=A0AAV4VQ26_CAEEX|nr:hypothetical protein CEXT_260041 [Caerostris extrusa]
MHLTALTHKQSSTSHPWRGLGIKISNRRAPHTPARMSRFRAGLAYPSAPEMPATCDPTMQLLAVHKEQGPNRCILDHFSPLGSRATKESEKHLSTGESY